MNRTLLAYVLLLSASQLTAQLPAESPLPVRGQIVAWTERLACQDTAPSVRQEYLFEIREGNRVIQIKTMSRNEFAVGEDIQVAISPETVMVFKGNAKPKEYRITGIRVVQSGCH